MFQCFIDDVHVLFYTSLLRPAKKSLVHTSKVDLPLSHTLQPPITHLMQSLVYCFGAQCAPLEHCFATVLSSRSQRVWWFHIVVVNDVSGMAGRALLKIYIFQLAASFPFIGLLRTSSLCPSFVKFIVTHILQMDFDLCAVLYVSDASRSIKYVMNRRCDESAYLHKVSNLSTSFHNSVACASSLLLIACAFSSALLFFPCLFSVGSIP